MKMAQKEIQECIDTQRRVFFENEGPLDWDPPYEKKEVVVAQTKQGKRIWRFLYENI